MRSLYLVFLLFVSTGNLNAQNPLHFTTYQEVNTFYNPAFTGLETESSVLAIGRVEKKQNFQFFPAFLVQFPLLKKIRTAISYENYWQRNLKTGQWHVDLSSSIKMGENKERLFYGIKASSGFFRPSYASINDPSSVRLFNIGFGLLYKTPTYFVGISSPAMIESHAYQSRIFHTQAGITNEINSEWKSELSVFVFGHRIDSPQLAAKALFTYLDQWTFGGYYQWSKNLGASFAYKINHRFKLGYSFNSTVFEELYKTSYANEVFLKVVL